MNNRINRVVLEAVKGKEHFRLIYLNTPVGRREAKLAVREWLLNCEIDFDRQDAERFWKAIDGGQFCGTCDPRVEGGAERETRRGKWTSK